MSHSGLPKSSIALALPAVVTPAAARETVNFTPFDYTVFVARADAFPRVLDFLKARLESN